MSSCDGVEAANHRLRLSDRVVLDQLCEGMPALRAIDGWQLTDGVKSCPTFDDQVQCASATSNPGSVSHVYLGFTTSI